MGQFDESKHQRAGDGRFASKPPAPEASAVTLKTPIREHTNRAISLKVEADETSNPVDAEEMRSEAARHSLASMVHDFEAEGVARASVERDMDEHGEDVWRVTGMYDEAGDEIGEGPYLDAHCEDNPWQDWSDDEYGESIDLGPAREWSDFQLNSVTPYPSNGTRSR